MAKNSLKYRVLEAAYNEFRKDPGLIPVGGFVITIAYVDGRVDSGAIGLTKAEAKRAIDAAKDGLTA
jgi:hypothetical protein